MRVNEWALSKTRARNSKPVYSEFEIRDKIIIDEFDKNLLMFSLKE